MRNLLVLLLLLGLQDSRTLAQEGSFAAFPIADGRITLTRLAQPQTPFDKIGQRFAMLGVESGRLEAWAFPLKLFRDFHLSFYLGDSTQPIKADAIVHRITVRPAVTTLTYVFQSFTVKAHHLTPVDEAGALILLEVDSLEPLQVVASFLPTLQPMWPAGLGGQYAFWDADRKAYLISESSRRNHGYIGSPAADGLSYTPAHMLSDQHNQFRITIPDPAAIRNRYIPIVMAGGKGDRTEVQATYDRLLADPERVYRETVVYYQALRHRTLQLHTPDDRLNTAFEWAKISYHNLRVKGPDFEGTGLVAGWDRAGPGGRPGFGWFFGGDTYLNTFSLNAMGDHQTVREAIAFLEPFQREDGKMAHEITQAVDYVDWFGDYPYAYIHADTSPYYLVAVHDYYRSTDDSTFVAARWPSLVRAFDWCLTTDGDGDGLMDNALAGLGALEFGALTGIQTDIYLAAIWIRALESMARLATVMQEPERADQARRLHRKALAAFEQFWDEGVGQYVYAFTDAGERVQELTPWSSVGLMWGMGTPERRRHSLEQISSAALTTDWGVRMLSDASPHYQPLNYNYGAVWPFLTSWVATAQFKNDLIPQGYAALQSTVQHVYERALGHVTEVFSGATHTWPQESVPHQGFCTAGTVLPLVRGLLGLEGDAPSRMLTFEPRYLAVWDTVALEGYPLGRNRFSFTTHQTANTLTVEVKQEGPEPYRLAFAPVFPPGTQVHQIMVDGAEVPFELTASAWAVQPRLMVDMRASIQIQVALTPTVSLKPFTTPSNVGDPSRGVRIMNVERVGQDLIVRLEGLAGETYLLPLNHPEAISHVTGAQWSGVQLQVVFPGRIGEGYVRHTIRIETKD